MDLLEDLNFNRSILKTELEDLKEQIISNQNKIVLKKQEIKDIDKKINKLKSNKLEISDHAILRYLERIENIDINKIKDRIKNELINEEIKNQVKILGNGIFPIKNNLKAVIKNNIVITIYPKDYN